MARTVKECPEVLHLLDVFVGRLAHTNALSDLSAQAVHDVRALSQLVHREGKDDCGLRGR